MGKKKRKDRRCVVCDSPLQGRGNRAIRCEPCQDEYRSQWEQERWSERASALQRMRRHGLSDPQPAGTGDDDVVDYSQHGDPLPGMRPVEGGYRSPPWHDTTRRVQRDHQKKNPGAAEETGQRPWDGMMQKEQSYDGVRFPPPPGVASTANPFYARDPAPGRGPDDLLGHATNGTLYDVNRTRTDTRGQKLLHEHLSRRF